MTNETEVTAIAPIDRPVTDPAARAAVVAELQAGVDLIREAMQSALVTPIMHMWTKRSPFGDHDAFTFRSGLAVSRVRSDPLGRMM